jgi:hypothetical protein
VSVHKEFSGGILFTDGGVVKQPQALCGSGTTLIMRSLTAHHQREKSKDAVL